MFNDALPPSIPVVQVSIDSSLDPNVEWLVGQALSPLRKEGVLIIAGGLTIHTFEDFDAFSEQKAGPEYIEFEKAIVNAAEVIDVSHSPLPQPPHPSSQHGTYFTCRIY